MIKPMLCKECSKPFDDLNYQWELKYDGIRALATVSDTGYSLQARSGSDKTKLFPELCLKTKRSAILDGEIVASSQNGKTEFNSIQHRANRLNGIHLAADKFPATYWVFDVLEVIGSNLRHTPLAKRRELLDAVLIPSQNVKLAPIFDGGVALFEKAKAEHLEGIIGKSRLGSYQEGKREWLKIKVWQEDNFMVIGYTDGTGWRSTSFGALVLSDMKGNYVGQVGTGFNDADISQLCQKFTPGVIPFAREPELATWVKPFGVKVRFLEYTGDGVLRFPSFKGIIS